MASVDTTSPHSNTIIQETAYADLYSLLMTLLQTPTQQLFAGLETGTIREDLIEIFEELDWDNPETGLILDSLSATQQNIAHSTYSFSDMRSEHTRLFAHPRKPAIALFEGVFLEKSKASGSSDVLKDMHNSSSSAKLMGMDSGSLLFINRAALDAERCYRKAGLQRVEEVNVPADCMTTEMEFMHYLHFEMASALQRDDVERLSELKDSMEEFSRIHLKKWMRGFYDALCQESMNGVYHATGLLGTLLSNVELSCIDSAMG